MSIALGIRGIFPNAGHVEDWPNRRLMRQWDGSHASQLRLLDTTNGGFRMGSRSVSLALLMALALAGALHAQALPPPRVLPPAAPMPLVNMAPPGVVVPVMPPAGRPLPSLPLAALPYPVPGYRPSAYQVWQNYGLSYQGWLLPRVIQTPQGGYFFYNGAPYPYVYVYPGHQIGSVAPAGAPGP
jgi:hypothetical protein